MDELVKSMLTQRVPAEGVLPATRQQQLSSDELGSTSYVENEECSQSQQIVPNGRMRTMSITHQGAYNRFLKLCQILAIEHQDYLTFGHSVFLLF